MNPAGGAGEQSLTHELNLIPSVLELVEIIANSSDQQQDITRKVASFRSRIQSCRDLLNKQPGLEMSLSQQEKELDLLQAQLKCKQDLLDKFSNLEFITSSLVSKEGD